MKNSKSKTEVIQIFSNYQMKMIQGRYVGGCGGTTDPTKPPPVATPDPGNGENDGGCGGGSGSGGGGAGTVC